MLSRLSHFSRVFHRAPKAPEAAPEAFGFYAIYFASFLFILSYGLPLYLASSFVEKYADKQIVGLVFALGAALGLLILSKIPPVLRRYGNRRTALVLMALEVLSLLGLVVFRSPTLVLPVFLVQQALLPVIIFNLDLFLESFSQDSSTGTIRGAYLALTNFAIFVAPFIAGIVFTNGEFWRIFLLAAVIMLPATFFVFFSLRTFHDPLYVDISFFNAFRSLRGKPNIRNIVLARFLLRFFYSWFTIYVPIYLHTEIGFSLSQIIGIILPVALLPFLIVQLPLGRMADRAHNERELLILGFWILALATAILSFVTAQNIWLWMGLFALGRTGAATVEVMTETYFYKHVDASNANLISIFRSIRPTGIIVGPLTATLILVVFHVPYQYLFVILGALLLLGIPLAHTLKPTQAE
ncbi:MAG TPA: MFS transporter [Candidatus Paceibacterota bacterium]|nr:MFS transporter [Candidatus Paceibacterota bacterium]